MRKTIYVSLMAFLVLFGCTKSATDLEVSSNEIQSQTPPINFTLSHSGTGGYYIPIICDGVTIDILVGSADWHCTMHYANHELQNMFMTYRGTLTSKKTGEVFTIKESENWNHPQEGMVAIQANIRGDMGSHILLFGSLNMETWEFTIKKTICQPN